MLNGVFLYRLWASLTCSSSLGLQYCSIFLRLSSFKTEKREPNFVIMLSFSTMAKNMRNFMGFLVGRLKKTETIKHGEVECNDRYPSIGLIY